VAQADNLMVIDAELRSPLMSAQLVRFDFAVAKAGVLRTDHAHLLDLSLTPRHNARACYRDHWSAHRFERIGDIFLVPAGEALVAKGDCGRQTSIICQLNATPLEAWLDGELEWTDRRLQATLDIANPNVRNLMLRLGEEMSHPGFASETLTELIAAQLAIELSRHYRSITSGPAAGGLSAWRLRLIDERLNALQDTPSLAELAKLCRLSVRQLTRGFRASRGCSIGDYVANHRIDHAKRLLKTDACVKSIAHAMGFSSPSSFSYAFRRATGETPRQFRQRAALG
jgi:AraC family transcriptional regulator